MEITNRALQEADAPLRSFLSSSGFEVVESENSDSFGNSYATLESPTLRLRVTIDRGNLSVDIGPKGQPETWYDLTLVSALVRSLVVANPLPPRVAGDFLADHYLQLVSLFGPDQFERTKGVLQRLQQERVSRMFGPQAGS